MSVAASEIMSTRPPKVMITKIGLDGHDRGSRVIAAHLRDQGMDVVYTPPWQDIRAVVRLAMDEDIDVLGVSSLATDHLLVPKLMKALSEAGLDHIRVIVGGIVPDDDEHDLTQAGVSRVFHPGSSLDEISESITALTREAQGRPPSRRAVMSQPRTIDGTPPPAEETARERWEREYRDLLPDDRLIRNRSGVPVKPMYTPGDWSDDRYAEDLGYPGQPPMTRGIYPTMHRGRTWTQRQLIGFAHPRDYNRRLRLLIDAGATAVSLIPCNSVYRGYDADQVEPELLGTCGVMLNTVDDMDQCFEHIDIGSLSTAQNDPSPFTLLALLLAVAKRRGIPWSRISGTSNQSDYISHFVANHMFFRLALPGARRILVDHIAFTQEHVPNWNPLSVVGQHMQQAGATPAEAMGFTLSTAIQYAEDCRARGMDPEIFLERFTFFFDISISFFEEIAKFRAGRRIWQRIVRERFGVDNPRAWRFKFHAQTSGADLTAATTSPGSRSRPWPACSGACSPCTPTPSMKC